MNTRRAPSTQNLIRDSIERSMRERALAPRDWDVLYNSGWNTQTQQQTVRIEPPDIEQLRMTWQTAPVSGTPNVESDVMTHDYFRELIDSVYSTSFGLREEYKTKVEESNSDKFYIKYSKQFGVKK